MPVETEADLAGMFDPDEFGKPGATYTPPEGGTPAPILIIDSRPVETISFGRTEIAADAATFLVPRFSLPNPRPNGLITIGAEVFVIQGEPDLDRGRDLWNLDTRPQGA
ncbi:MAG: head-tail joining protein [Inquilinus sp.]|uniref:head-tail joining protein n=1 Tax=Inquilinus sp. TaxID=1932117 RepID=UPI003F35E976